MNTNEKTLRRVVAAIAIALFLVQIVVCVYGMPRALRGQSFFRGLYTAASMVRSGHARELYDVPLPESTLTNQGTGLPGFDHPNFDRPAYEALLFVPFSLLNYRAAYLAFFVVNLFLLWLSLAMLRPYFEKLPSVWSWFPAAVFFCFLPVALALVQGQDSILLLTLLIASAVFFYRRQELRSGVFLGLALFNFPLAIPIALLFLLWRRWRIVIGFAVTAAGVAVVSWRLTGLAPLVGQARAAIFGVPGAPRAAAQLPNLRCLFDALAGTHLSAHSVLMVTAIVSIAMILWAATRHPNYALAILITLLVSQRGAIQDAATLILPVGLVLEGRILPISRSHRWSRNIAGMLFVGPTLLFLAGLSYCALSLLMLGLVVTLRSTSVGYLDD